MDVMTPDHPCWDEFCDRLEGPEGCNFHKDRQGETRWWCHAGTDKRAARRILVAMGFDAPSVDASCAFFESNGGFCDCEILFNVEAHVDALKVGGLRVEGVPRTH